MLKRQWRAALVRDPLTDEAELQESMQALLPIRHILCADIPVPSHKGVQEITSARDEQPAGHPFGTVSAFRKHSILVCQRIGLGIKSTVSLGRFRPLYRVGIPWPEFRGRAANRLELVLIGHNPPLENTETAGVGRKCGRQLSSKPI
jgi:hypothetical protein